MAVAPIRYNTGPTGSDTENLLLKMYLGSYVEAPRASTFFLNNPTIYRTTPNAGKSFQFLMDADTPAPEEYEPGNDLLGQAYGRAEGTLTTDRVLVAHAWVSEEDMEKDHAQILGRLGPKHAAAMDRLLDQRALRTGLLGARQSALTHTNTGLNVHMGGTRVYRNGGSGNTTHVTNVAAAYPATSGGFDNLTSDFRTMYQTLIEKNLDGNSFTFYCTPHIRTVLQNGGVNLYSADYVGTMNQLQTRQLNTFEGFRFGGVITLDSTGSITSGGPWPTTNITSGPTKYQGNFLPQASDGSPAVLFVANAGNEHYGVGMVEFRAPTQRVLHVPERMGYLVYTFAMLGFGVMHPWCLGSLETRAV